MSSLTPGMEDVPRILVLDDEGPQRITIRHQLRELGVVLEFADPRAALAHLRQSMVDAVILDIRMPRSPVDGLWFLSQLREFDRELAVVLRTGDTDVAIAQAGIEGRAVQRIIKSEPDSRRRLRQAVQSAVAETRERRRTSRLSADAAAAHDRLVSTLGRLDSELTVGELCRGFVRRISNQVTALNGYADLLVEDSELRGDPAQAELTRRNQAAAAGLSEELRNFLVNPFIDGSQVTASAGRMNACVEALDQYFQGHRVLTERRQAFAARGLLPDLTFAANPSRTTTALRHLIEYCASRAPEEQVIALAVTLASGPREVGEASRTGLLINRRAAQGRASAVVRVESDLGAFPLDRIRDDLGRCSDNPRLGNLLMLGAAIVEEQLTLTVTRTDRGSTVLSLFLPLAL